MTTKMIKTKNFKLAIYSGGNEDANKIALVLPGRLDTKDYVHMTSHVDFLAERGYYALSFDMPGTWESPGNIAEYTTTNYIKAVNELVDYLGNKPTLLLGHSRGGARWWCEARQWSKWDARWCGWKRVVLRSGAARRWHEAWK